MAYRTRAVPDRKRSDYTVNTMRAVAVQDPRLKPHRERIFVDCDGGATFEFYLGYDENFTLSAMYQDGRPVREVHPDQGWSPDAALEVGGTVTILFDIPTLPRDTWTIHQIEVTTGH